MEHPYTELAPVYELLYIPRLSRAYYNLKKKLAFYEKKIAQKNDNKDSVCTREYQLDRLGQFARGNSFPFSVEKVVVYTHQSLPEITINLSNFDKIFSKLTEHLPSQSNLSSCSSGCRVSIESNRLLISLSNDSLFSQIFKIATEETAPTAKNNTPRKNGSE